MAKSWNMTTVLKWAARVGTWWIGATSAVSRTIYWSIVVNRTESKLPINHHSNPRLRSRTVGGGQKKVTGWKQSPPQGGWSLDSRDKPGEQKTVDSSLYTNGPNLGLKLKVQHLLPLCSETSPHYDVCAGVFWYRRSINIFKLSGLHYLKSEAAPLRWSQNIIHLNFT